MKQSFLERIKESPIVFDGAMGTMIYEKGVFLNVCYDELCVKSPQLIKEIHREYAQAGAEVIETNTFGANRIKLGQHGLSTEVEAINRAGVKLAREVAGEDLYVAASVGPCLRPGQMMNSENRVEVETAFKEQLGFLIDEGVDVIMFETFPGLDELELAIWTLRGISDIPLVASFTVDHRGETALGISVENMAEALDRNDGVSALGLNCGVGPSQAYDALEAALEHTSKPVIVLPNAGLPREVEGRMLYLNNPEYFTEYAKKFIEMGVRGIGGCCGTTPEHIRMASRAIKTMSGVKHHIQIRSYEEEESQVEIIPPEKKSRFSGLLHAGKKVSSVELVPPKSCDMSMLLERARECHLHGVDAINIPDGPRASSRVSPMIAAIAIRNQIGIEPILHYCCRDRNLIGMQSDLLGGYAAGLANFLIITGDPPKLGDYPDATGVFDVDAIGLTQVTANLNRGRDIGGSQVNPPTGIFIGVGANPVAVEPEREMQRYLAKIDAGAEYAITQPVFDTQALFRFLDEASKHHRQIPLIAGVWPLVSFKNAEFMNNEVPGVEVPEKILERMAKCKTKEDGVKTGIEISREICEEIRDSVAGYQVSAPFGRVEIALDVLE
ncbi:MAG: bifunctional homocysteine S-methyltransferase/methylenetetrahydrofolate reductase [Candidatus Sumerlaeia bacterium]